MASKKGSAPRETTATEPKFPYTTMPGSLRRLLKEIPKRPKPTKIDRDLIKGWGFRNSNDYTTLRVLKAVNLLNDKNEPTDLYTQFMSISGGARYLAPEIVRLYNPMFQAAHTPFNESSETLKNLFNIHSGGGEKTIELQIQTFKALCENADFTNQGTNTSTTTILSPTGTPITSTASTSTSQPTININLHIHLPENKSRRDYEAMIEDIGRHIFGRDIAGSGNV